MGNLVYSDYASLRTSTEKKHKTRTHTSVPVVSLAIITDRMGVTLRIAMHLPEMMDRKESIKTRHDA